MQQFLVDRGGDHHGLFEVEGLAEIAFQLHVLRQGRRECHPDMAAGQSLRQELVDPASRQVHPHGNLRLCEPFHMVEPGSLHHQICRSHRRTLPDVTLTLHL